LRNDDISTIGLYRTEARQPLATIRQDAVLQTSAAASAQNEIGWTPWLRTVAGARLDGYRFQVDAGEPLNAGTAQAGLISPKGGLVIGPFSGTEFYVNAGVGFHSNDARGATIAVDPSTGQPADRVTPLARAKGAEVGVRTVAIPHVHTSVALWMLNLESELIFSGDAGTTEAGRPSHRQGLELANYFSPAAWLTFDGDLSVSRSRFTNLDAAGAWIPGSVETVVSAGATIDSLQRFFGSVRLRYFGPRPLIEDNSVRSRPTTLVNLEGGYRLAKNAGISLDVFNLLNAADSDIDYYYASRLPGEPAAGVSDIHLHPALPRTARLNLRLGF
jgi:outer membrane receptor protein involved in Fe transport